MIKEIRIIIDTCDLCKKHSDKIHMGIISVGEYMLPTLRVCPECENKIATGINELLSTLIKEPKDE